MYSKQALHIKRYQTMFNRLHKVILAFVTLLIFSGFSSPAEAKYRPGWNTARQVFMRGAMTDPRQPRFIRGILRNQVNRWHRKGKTGFPRLKNPSGYDIGHHPMRRGSINPKDLRFEITNANRGRPQRAKARGRRLGFMPKYF
jgi:hypothetical protein